MNNDIKNAYLRGKLILFLGAGASKTSETRQGAVLPDGAGLAKMIANRFGWVYNKEPLASVYAAAKQTNQNELEQLLSEQYRSCKPSVEYIEISKYPWPRVYTTNIDDAFDRALDMNSVQDCDYKNRQDTISPQDNTFQRLEVVHLNGMVSQLGAGFIFSSQEYGSSAHNMPLWYQELGVDYTQYQFLFVGTKLHEPLFYQQIQYYLTKTGGKSPKSFVLTPSATDIERRSLEASNLTHVPGTLKDFSDWMRAEVEQPEPFDLAIRRNPALRGLIDSKASGDRKTLLDAFMDIDLVSRQVLASAYGGNPKGRIRNFYRGFKPSWLDILDSVPADLHSKSEFLEVIGAKSKPEKVVLLLGPAGSGKSTVMKQCALACADAVEIPPTSCIKSGLFPPETPVAIGLAA